MCRGGTLRGYAEGACRGGTQRGYTEGYAEGCMEGVCRGGTQKGYVEGVHGGGIWRGMLRGYVEGYAEGVQNVALATIDLIGDNRELGSFRDILRSYTHYVWLIVSEH